MNNPKREIYYFYQVYCLASPTSMRSYIDGVLRISLEDIERLPEIIKDDAAQKIKEFGGGANYMVITMITEIE